MVGLESATIMRSAPAGTRVDLEGRVLHFVQRVEQALSNTSTSSCFFDFDAGRWVGVDGESDVKPSFKTSDAIRHPAVMAGKAEAAKVADILESFARKGMLLKTAREQRWVIVPQNTIIHRRMKAKKEAEEENTPNKNKCKKKKKKKKKKRKEKKKKHTSKETITPEFTTLLEEKECNKGDRKNDLQLQEDRVDRCSVEALISCPGSHSLLRFETPHDRFKCDECFQAIAEGECMFGCRTCDFDMCAGCHTRHQVDAAKPKPKPRTEEDAPQKDEVEATRNAPIARAESGASSDFGSSSDSSDANKEERGSSVQRPRLSKVKEACKLAALIKAKAQAKVQAEAEHAAAIAAANAELQRKLARIECSIIAQCEKERMAIEAESGPGDRGRARARDVHVDGARARARTLSDADANAAVHAAASAALLSGIPLAMHPIAAVDDDEGEDDKEESTSDSETESESEDDVPLAHISSRDASKRKRRELELKRTAPRPDAGMISRPFKRPRSADCTTGQNRSSSSHNVECVGSEKPYTCAAWGGRNEEDAIIISGDDEDEDAVGEEGGQGKEAEVKEGKEKQEVHAGEVSPPQTSLASEAMAAARGKPTQRNRKSAAPIKIKPKLRHRPHNLPYQHIPIPPRQTSRATEPRSLSWEARRLAHVGWMGRCISAEGQFNKSERIKSETQELTWICGAGAGHTWRANLRVMRLSRQCPHCANICTGGRAPPRCHSQGETAAERQKRLLEEAREAMKTQKQQPYRHRFRFHGRSGGTNSGSSRNTPLPMSKFEEAAVVLGLRNGASRSELKARHRKLVKIYHPDKNNLKSTEEKAKAETEFKKIQSAYEQLLKLHGTK